MAGIEMECIDKVDHFRFFVGKWRKTSLGLVDSRLPELFTKSHISGSTNVPHDDLSNRGTLRLDFEHYFLLIPLIVVFKAHN